MFKPSKTYIGPILALVSKRQIAFFLAIYGSIALFETFGFSMMLPVLRYLEEGPEGFDIESLPAYWSWVLSIVTDVGLPVTLVTLLGLAFVPMLVRQVFHLVRSWYVARLTQSGTARLRNEGFSAFIESDLQFHASQKQGELLSALTMQSQRSGEMVSNLLGLVGTLIMLVIYVALLLAISPLMTLIGLATAGAASLLVGMTIIPKSKAAGRKAVASYDGAMTSMTEEISGVRLVKMLAQEEKAGRKVSGFVNSIADTLVWFRVLQGWVRAVVEGVFLFGLFGMVYLGVELLDTGLASLGILFLVLLRMMPLALQVNTSRQALEAGAASLARLQDLTREAKSARKIASGNVRLAGLERSVDFDHVSFRYDEANPDIWALQDVSFSIPKGTMTALVGRSGAGKSTLVDLIPRLRDVTSGSLTIDGVNVKDMDLESLRRSVGYLSQETFLFNDTIYNNIAYGLPAATADQVKEAAKRAYAHEFIEETSHGYAAIVGDRGIRLSAGQRQRLGIARVMLQKPALIILDEPTSALDSESEDYIRQALELMRKEQTFIVIAHRLSTIQQADQIIVLDNGRVVEKGNHQVLLGQNGSYSRLFELQIDV